MNLLIVFLLLCILIFSATIYIRWQEAAKMSPYPIYPSLHNMVLNGQIYLNLFTWDKEVLIHEMAHVIRGKGPENSKYEDPDHDIVFWNVYDNLMKKYNIPHK